jgi:hypothetical protein
MHIEIAVCKTSFDIKLMSCKFDTNQTTDIPKKFNSYNKKYIEALNYRKTHTFEQQQKAKYSPHPMQRSNIGKSLTGLYSTGGRDNLDE